MFYLSVFVIRVVVICFMSVCLSVDRVCQCNSVTIMLDTVTKLCVVKIKMKGKFKNSCGPSKGAGRSEVTPPTRCGKWGRGRWLPHILQ